MPTGESESNDAVRIARTKQAMKTLDAWTSNKNAKETLKDLTRTTKPPKRTMMTKATMTKATMTRATKATATSSASSSQTAQPPQTTQPAQSAQHDPVDPEYERAKTNVTRQYMRTTERVTQQQPLPPGPVNFTPLNKVFKIVG